MKRAIEPGGVRNQSPQLTCRQRHLELPEPLQASLAGILFRPGMLCQALFFGHHLLIFYDPIEYVVSYFFPAVLSDRVVTAALELAEVGDGRTLFILGVVAAV